VGTLLPCLAFQVQSHIPVFVSHTGYEKWKSFCL
jgi:hypothetical protein